MCKREFLDVMNLVVPWAELMSLIAAHAPTRSAKVIQLVDGTQTTLTMRAHG